MRSAFSPARSMSFETALDVFAIRLLALPTVFVMDFTSPPGLSDCGSGTPSTFRRCNRLLSTTPPATPAAAAPTAIAGVFALSAACFAVSAALPTVDVGRLLLFDELVERDRLLLLRFAPPLAPLCFVLREAFVARPELLFDFDAEPFEDALLFVLREAFLVVAILIPSFSGMAPPLPVPIPGIARANRPLRPVGRMIEASKDRRRGKLHRANQGGTHVHRSRHSTSHHHPDHHPALSATRGTLMQVLRSRLGAAVAALAFAATGLAACGDDDEKGAAEDVEQGVKEGADEVEEQGNEIDDDVKGTDEKRQKDK